MGLSVGFRGVWIFAGDVRDEIVALLGLLETTEGHLGTGDELLGVLEVGELRDIVSRRSERN